MTDTQYLYQYFLEQSNKDRNNGDNKKAGKPTAAFKTAETGDKAKEASHE